MLEREHLSKQIEEEHEAVSTVGNTLTVYLNRTLEEQQNPDLQFCPFTDRPWGEVLSRFSNNLPERLRKIKNTDELFKLTVPLVRRGMELVSGGVVSNADLAEGQERGLQSGGTWPSMAEETFWDPRKFHNESEAITNIVHEVLRLPTNASQEHVGRVITMSLPAMLSWSDLRSGMIPRGEVIDAVKRMLEAEREGKFSVVTFGCEPYEYEHAPNTTASFMRRSEFGSDKNVRRDAIQGSFRGVRRILEPLTLSGVRISYDFYTSFGSDWNLIQRQVMPDTINSYRENPNIMLDKLQSWRNIIDEIGTEELSGSSIDLFFHEMETSVVLSALQDLANVLQNCGMSMPVDMNQFYYGSEEWFANHIHELTLLALLKHPNPELLVKFLTNEDEWSKKHVDTYRDEEQRIVQSLLLSFFELHQYQRINEIINASDGYPIN